MTRRITTTTIWALTLFLATALSLSSFSLRLKHRAEVAGDTVYLTDLFTLAGEVENVALFPTPSQEKTYTLIALLPFLDTHFGAADYNVSGTRVTIAPAGKTTAYDSPPSPSSETTERASKSASPLADAMERTLARMKQEERLKRPGLHYRVRTFYDIPNLSSLYSKDHYFTFDFGKNGDEGMQTVTVTLHNRYGEKVRTFDTIVEVFRVKRVLVAARYLPKDRILQSNDIEVRELPVKGVPHDALLDASAIKHTVTRLPVSKGSVLRRQDITPHVVIRRGEHVFVRYERGGVRVEVAAIAMENAREGDVFRLQNAKTKRELRGRVEDGTVRFAR